MEKIPISKFKAQCLGILDIVHKEKKRIIITRRGIPIAEVRSLEATDDKKIPLKDTVLFMGDIVSPVSEDEWEVLN